MNYASINGSKFPMHNPDSPAIMHFDLGLVAERLRIARESSGLSQPEFADVIGYSRRQLSSWEAGTTAPPIAVLIALRRLGNIDPEWILFGPGLTPLTDVPPETRARGDRVRDKIMRAAQSFGLALPSDTVEELAASVLREPIGAEKTALTLVSDTLRAISTRKL